MVSNIRVFCGEEFHDCSLSRMLLYDSLSTGIVSDVFSDVMRGYTENERIGRRLEEFDQDPEKNTDTGLI